MLFSADYSIQEIAEAYAEDAKDHAYRTFSIKLDNSKKSIRDVEFILNKMHKALKKDSPEEADIFLFAKIYGSYVGEILRKHHQAEWGIAELDEEKFPGMRLPTDTIFWPWGKVNNRLTQGEEDNIYHYYLSIVSEEAEPDLPKTPRNLRKWWKWLLPR